MGRQTKTVLVVLGHDEEPYRRARAACAMRYLGERPETEAAVFTGHNGETDDLIRLAQEQGLGGFGGAIYHEVGATNTRENAILTAAVLRKHGFDLRTTRIVLVTNRSFRVRQRLTFRALFRSVEAISGAEPVPHDSLRFKLRQWAKTVRYLFRGHLYPGSLVFGGGR